jgi:hypothetical protein
MKDNIMIADRDVLIDRRPRKMCTPTLTTTEVRILRFYKSIAEPDKTLGVGKYFIRSLPSIAAVAGCSTKTVRRANEHFAQLGVLLWASGHGNGIVGKGQANQYGLEMRGWHGYDNPLRGITPAMLAAVRRQLRQVSGKGFDGDGS